MFSLLFSPELTLRQWIFWKWELLKVIDRNASSLKLIWIDSPQFLSRCSSEVFKRKFESSKATCRNQFQNEAVGRESCLSLRSSPWTGNRPSSYQTCSDCCTETNRTAALCSQRIDGFLEKQTHLCPSLFCWASLACPGFTKLVFICVHAFCSLWWWENNP